MIVEPNCGRRLMCAAYLAFSLTMSSALLFGESADGKSQPDRLDFGSVRMGATVEGSILVFTDAEESADLSCDVEPPPFLKVTSIRRGTATDRSGITKSDFCINVAVSSEEMGEHAGTLAVAVGLQKTTIPVKVNVRTPDASATRILIVSTPFSSSSTGDATVFDPWLRLVESAKLNPDYLNVVRDQPVLRDLDLSDYGVVLLGEYGLLRLQDADIAKLKQFVNDGGRLLVCANSFFQGTVDRANQLLVPAGLRMTDSEPNDPKPIELTGSVILKDPLTKSVRRVKCFRPSPIAVTDKSKGRILVKAPQYPGEGFVAAGRHGKGQVVALGQSLWWNWLGDVKYGDCDNWQLLLNLIAKTPE
ncbi:MAG: hypothetical protein KIS67_04890 [Verrucomicrobiae bacterium]|nr:hypothetical protein [Verrucomicrobiae bacterium]